MDMQSEEHKQDGHHRSELPILSIKERNSPQDDSPPAISPSTQDLPSTTSATSSTATTRRARLSHRSRAGCWTCRGRKVKCDEQRPRCGQCLRLDRECDWEHRWSFNHATTTTKERHANVSTSGSVVWDPQARQSGTSLSRSRSNDNLPAFATLTNDDDRQRKARSAIPGTYSVVITPESFASLPEYASSGSSSPGTRLVAEHSRHGTQSLIARRRTSSTDTNTVVLEQFEDIAATSAPISRSFSSRSSSVPGNSLHPPPQMSTGSYPTWMPPLTTSFDEEDSKLSACFNQYLVYRLIPWIDDSGTGTFSNLAKDRSFIRAEAEQFAPLWSAIDALSALHLYYSGHAQLATAVDYYDRALSTQTPMDQDEHLSDGVFLRHFLLYAYDISMTPQTHPSTTEEASMSATNLTALHTLAVQRLERNGSEKYAYIVWLLGLLDLEACFMGSGDCHYLRELQRSNAVPSLASTTIAGDLHGQVQVPVMRSQDVELLQLVLDFQQGIVIQLANLAALAKRLRVAVLSSGPDMREMISRCQVAVQQAQTELKSCWSQYYPHTFDPTPSNAATRLPPPIRPLFEHTVSLYNAGIIYSHTSMFPGQRTYNSGGQRSLDAEIEACKDGILEIASNMLANQRLDQRWIIFPVFMAGIASKQSDAMIQALEIIRGYEGSGIGQNTRLVRQLLTAVNEEQSQRIATGQPMEDIDWQAVAIEKGFRISNCGL